MSLKSLNPLKIMTQPTLLETLSRLRSLPREAATVEFKSNLEDPTEIG